ncbi:hypothetical protein [Mycoplasma capricolum]|uniref:hypothetical protein n=1 Tax=Mycoplasma capricolum TaxID=2095 RepID=UPI00062A2B07|nr:hypothetical protein [Mycoplasma capricolum]KKW61482.1 hypothetical protein AAK27_309 [Mycoplasma capricolum subsp. capricolum]
MKKNLTILSSLGILSTSFVIVSCKKPNNISIKFKDKNTEKDLNNKLEKSNNKNKDVETINSNDTSSLTDINRHKNENTNADLKKQNDTSKDIMPRKDQLSEKDKEEKTNQFANKLKIQVEEMIKKMKDDEIIILSTELNSKIIESTFNNEASRKIADLNNRVAKLFEKPNINSLDVEINLLISENFDEKQHFTDKEKNKIKEILANATTKPKENKDKIITDIDQLFTDLLTNEFQKKLKESTDQLKILLSKKEYEKVKEELFKLVDKVEELEKLFLKNNKNLINF